MQLLIQQQSHPVEVEINTSSAHSLFAALALLTAGTADGERFRNEPWLQQLGTALSEDEERLTRDIFSKSLAPFMPEPQEDQFADYLDRLRRTVEADTVDHLRHMWRQHFRPEWERHHYLQSIADNLRTRDWPLDSAETLIQAFLRRPVPDFIGRQLAGVERVIFCISPFLALQAARFDAPTDLWLFLPADPRQLPMRYEPIQRTEVTRVANALADEARLQILEMLAAFGPMRSQEIKEQLDVSQPTVSRQLKQLKNTHFIREKRDGDSSKIFALNRDRLGEVTFLLETLLSRDNARMVLNDPRLDQPAELRKFLNEDGLVHRYPNKLNAQKLVLVYLAPKFEAGKKYTEKEVNALLNRWHTYKDPARLRRDLVDHSFLARTADGSQYWRVE